MSKPRISQVSIRQFRGIPTELTLSLVPPASNSPVSLILFGDNGTGKSSIVDSIEFALQARIRRSRDNVAPMGPNSSALGRHGEPHVEVGLSNGKTVRRGFQRDADGERIVHGPPPPSEFSHAPFILRRSDILMFITTPEVKRQLIFTDYRLGDPSNAEPSQDLDDLHASALAAAQERLYLAKAERRKLAVLVAKQLNVMSDEVPLQRQAFEALILDRIYHGLSGKEAKRRGIRRPTPDQYTSSVLDRYRAALSEVDLSNGELSRLKSFGKSRFDGNLSGIREVLEDVASKITALFLEVSNAKFVERILLSCGDTSVTSARLEVVLADGKTFNPERVLSEANLDLLAILIFLGFAQSAADRGQAMVLVLDDVFQSVDSTIRVAVVDLILRRFREWQLIFTVHDRLWQEQLRHLFRQHGIAVLDKEIVRWDFQTGPVIRDARRDPDQPLLEAIETTDVARICSAAGLLLEEACAQMSWALPISVKRKRGDKYELGDLWPGVYKIIKKTALGEAGARVERWLHLRNAVGAHYNEWAQSVSLEEARAFGEAVIEFFWGVHCDKCHRWLEIETERYWRCRCGQTTLVI